MYSVLMANRITRIAKKLGFSPTLDKSIFQLAGPVVFAMLIQILCNIADEIMVNHLPGAKGNAAGAALGMAVPLLWLIGGFGAAIGVGTQVLTARRVGEGNNSAAGQILSNSLALAVFLGAVLCLLAYFIAEPIFRLLHSNELVVKYGAQYTQIRALSIIGWMGTYSYKAFFDGLGKTKIHLYAAIAMAIINIGLNAILIFGCDLEVLGASIGSTTSTFVGCIVMMLWSFKRKYREKYGYYQFKNVSTRLLRAITNLSLPSGIATVVIMSGFLVFWWVAAGLDLPRDPFTTEPAYTAVMDAMGIIRVVYHDAFNANATQVLIALIEGVVFIPCLAFGTATSTLVSQSIGRKKFKLATRYGIESVKVATSLFGLVAIFIIIFPEVAMRIFTPQAGTIETGYPTLRMMGFFIFVIPAALIFPQALFGTGNTKFVMYLELFLHFCILVPLSFLFGRVLNMGLIGIWVAAGLYVTLLGLGAGWKFLEGKWKQIKL